jgi:hypothetical protein
VASPFKDEQSGVPSGTVDAQNVCAALSHKRSSAWQAARA